VIIQTKIKFDVFLTTYFLNQRMELIDTHIHLYADEFESDLGQLISNATEKGVKKFLMPNIDQSSIDKMFAINDQFKGTCFPMVGLHPCYVNNDFKSQLASIKKALDSNLSKVVAVGEIGLDYYWDVIFKKEQQDAFREQAIWANELNLPISIHSRNSTAELIEILHELQLPKLKGVFHCFSGNINQADDIMNMGFYLGIGGVVTFKNSGLEKIVEEVPLEFIILETDGPYLAPTPFRGKVNKPEYLRLVAEKVADIKNLKIEEIATITSANASKLFGLE
jgi:TatD DNase family protein